MKLFDLRLAAIPAMMLVAATAHAQSQPIRIGQTTGSVLAQAAPAEPTLAQIKAELAALKAEVASLKNAIAAQENARKSLATQHFTVAGKVNMLVKDFYSHQHHQNFLSVSNNVQTGGVNQSLNVMQVSPPISTCSPKQPPSTKIMAAQRWDDRYTCTPPAP